MFVALFQGDCKASWAITAVSILEYIREDSGELRGNDSLSLSYQFLLDCTPRVNGYGCFGGDPLIALQYVKKYKVHVPMTKFYPIGTEVSYFFNFLVPGRVEGPL